MNLNINNYHFIHDHFAHVQIKKKRKRNSSNLIDVQISCIHPTLTRGTLELSLLFTTGFKLNSVRAPEFKPGF